MFVCDSYSIGTIGSLENGNTDSSYVIGLKMNVKMPKMKKRIEICTAEQ